MHWIGLTGGIGAGKSTVARLLAERGAVIVDADVLAREVVEPGTQGLAEVLAGFGDSVRAPDGSLDRKALAARVFSDPAELARLNAMLHPRVAALTAQRRDAAPPEAVVVHDIPLLVEVGAAGQYDLVVVVEAAESTRIARLVASRGMTAADARARIAAQADSADLVAAADLVIDNDGSYEELVADVDELWVRLQQ